LKGGNKKHSAVRSSEFRANFIFVAKFSGRQFHLHKFRFLVLFEQTTNEKIVNNKFTIPTVLTISTKKRKRDGTAQSSVKTTSTTLFWSGVSKTLSEKMWFQATEQTKSIGILRNNLWFNVNVMKGKATAQNMWNWKTIQQSHDDNKSVEEPSKNKAKAKKSDKEAAEKAINIRLYPSNEQDPTLKKWFGAARWTYNQCLSAVVKGKIKKTKKDLRVKFLNASNFEKENKWVLEVPNDVRDEAMNNLLKVYKSNFAKGDKFQIKYRKKKDERESIPILNKHWSRKSGVYSFLSRMKSAEPLTDKLQYDSRLIRTRLGHYYLCVSKPLEIRSEN
jgi:hypothetical protein